MLELTEIEALLIACLPAITSIISIISAAIAIIKNLNKLKDNKNLKAERDALVEQNQILLSEVRKQKKLIALYIEKVVKIKYGDLTEVQNDEDLKV